MIKISLQESLWVIGCKQAIEPHADVFTGCFKFDWVTLLGRVELSTVTAVSAVGGLCKLVQNRAVLALGSPLPGVFGAIRKESVCALNVKAALIDSRLESTWQSVHIEAGERSLAHFWPVAELEHLGPHGVDLARGLEPAVLSAILVSPRAGS